MFALTALTILASLALVGQVFWLGTRGDSDALLLPDDERKRHYVWGLLYMNPDDPRGWVPKTWGVGWTVNYRTMAQVRLFVALLVVTLGSAITMTYLAYLATL